MSELTPKKKINKIFGESAEFGRVQTEKIEFLG